MEKISQIVMTFLLNSLWQVALITAVAWLSDRLIQKAPARQRQLLWVTTLLLSLLLPLWSLHLLLKGTPSLGIVQNDPTFAASDGYPIEGGVWFGDMLRNRNRPLSFAPTIATALSVFYSLFLLYRLARFFMAWQRTRKIARSARVHAIPDLMAGIAAKCRNKFGLGEIAILSSPDVAGPLTLGVLQPVIMLPERLFEVESSETLTSVLGHEMAHIHRHDFLLNIFYEFFYLPISFHPAAALVKRRINETRELTCDDMVTERLVDASTYARTLVTIAQSISTMGRSNYTLGVFDANILEERIMRLIRKEKHGSKPIGKLPYLAAILVLALSCVTASAFSFIVQNQERPIETNSGQYLVGVWKLFPSMEGKGQKSEGEARSERTDPILISLRVEGDQLVGAASVKKGDQRVEWPLITPKFDGKIFTFKVNNGEELLEGAMKLVDGVFIGKWISSESKLGGTLKMIRKE